MEEVSDMRQGKGVSMPSSFAIMTMLAALVLAFALVGCAEEEPVVDVEGNQTDEMFSDDVAGDELYVFQIDDQSIAIGEMFYTVDIITSTPMRDGGFYHVVADVTYLNGGVAGYVDYPEVGSVSSCEEVSPLDIGLPSIHDKSYGLLLIGDYADGDVLFREMGVRAVWKDGAWVYRYDSDIELSDGTQACVREGVSQADVQKGKDQGVLSCDNYFILPPSAEL